ncbi:hypothetical protein FRUB_00510 [Fimbriiglobus ruber]|uniref:Uncharacterized protein n=2 Tax=Fimbriiglobus ruber TaxID=1908690 RepID=A0A225DZN9_9BACT|nr:hypothetical protein FRUB_00510 [Fimbriiglobus ruber]
MLEMVPQTPPVVRARDGMDAWSELSGHVQSWDMFSTGNLPASVFLEVDIRFANGDIVTVRSPFEPQDPVSAVRPPVIYNRVFNYEMRLGLLHQFMLAEAIPKDADEWRKTAFKFVRQNNWYMRAYLKCVWADYRAAHPDAPEDVELVLKARQHRNFRDRVRSAEEITPTVWPSARWLPARAEDPAFLPIEAYDPVDRVFVRLPAGEQP